MRLNCYNRAQIRKVYIQQKKEQLYNSTPRVYKRVHGCNSELKGQPGSENLGV